MPSTKKTRKAHNPAKRLATHARSVLRNHHVAIAYSYTNEQMSLMVHAESGKKITPHSKLIEMLDGYKHSWCVLVGALCEEDNGTRYLKAEEVMVNEPYLRTDIVPILEEHHAILLKGCNPAHLRNAVWLASPYGKSFTEEEAFNLFAKLDFFDELKEPTTA